MMAVPETGADSGQQCRRRPTTTKGSWEGSAVFSLGVTASFLIKDMIGHDRVQNCSSCTEFYVIWRKIYLGKRTKGDSGFTVARASVSPHALRSQNRACEVLMTSV
jgi:hypothetical protein